MKSLLLRAVYPVGSALIALLLSALATAMGLTGNAQAATLTVRAYANLAGNVGAMMTVRVDGSAIGSVEVRATVPQDYSFTVPTLKPGSAVDVAYTNNTVATAGGDRNLYVLQLRSADTALQPDATNSHIDRGADAAAFDGADTLPGNGSLYWNAALRVTWPAPNLTHTITVRASGAPAGDIAPHMVLRIDGIVIASVDVIAVTPTDHVFTAPAFAAGSKVDVAFTNAGSVNGASRTLNVHYLKAGTSVLRPTDAGVRFDAGSGLAAYDGTATTAGQVAMTSNGAVRGNWPAPNMTDILTVRASGVMAAGVGPIAQILADGVLLGTYEIRSSAPTDITLPALPLKPGQRIEVRPTNLGTFNGETRRLNVAYVLSGTTVLQANAGSLDATWPAPNLTDTLNIRARGTLAGGVGPVMQVLVDGILVGATEVKSTVFADYRFAVPPMDAGRKVDVVFTNPEAPTGQGRNLHVAYLTTGNTVLLPTAPGNLYDRGTGAGAFDGLDTLAPTGNLYWGGALRTTWPTANINSTLTVRASAVQAGGVGALMILWIDGVAVSSVEVKSATPTDYLMPATAIQPGTQVAITFANRGTVDGVTRTLNVHYAIAGTTFLTPSSSGATYAGGDLSAAWPSPNITDTLTVRAYADLANGTGAMVTVYVDGVAVSSQEINSTVPADYRFGVPVLKPGSRIDLAYTNNSLNTGTADRNLYVVQLNHGKTAWVPSPTNSTIDKGVGAAAFDGADVIAGQSALFWDATLRLSWPEANLTDRITVRASGTPAGGVAPQMIVRVDGVVVGTASVTATTPTDHVFDTPAYAAGSRVDVAFANAGTADDVARALNVHYLMAGTTVLRPTDAGVKFDAGVGLAAYDGATFSPGQVALATSGALRAAWPAPNMTDSLTVRASGTLAANVGPVMQVLVDGVLIGTVEVRSTTPVDVALPSLPIAVGAQVDIVYTNDAVIAGEDRNLSVHYALAGKTVWRPTDAGVVFDYGSGAAAFDGVNTTAGKVLLGSLGALHGTWPAPNLTDTVNVRARGMLAGGVGPIMQLVVDGVVVGSAEVRSAEFADYTFAVPPMSAGRKVDVVFTNDAVVNGEDRNLYVAYLTTGNTVLLPSASGNTYDRGAGAAAFDGLNVYAGSGTMAWGGALRTTWPAPNITDTLTIRASATQAGGVGALMILWVDGVAVSSVVVNSATPTDYLMPSTPIKVGSKLAIVFSNRGNVEGVTRALNVHYAMAGSTYLAPSLAGVAYADGDLSAVWPKPNITDSLTVRAYADLAGGVGAMMQLRIDGVIVGTQEVKSSAAADYIFAIPKLAAGSRIDVVYINDGQVNGVDRNLYLQYMRYQNGTIVPYAGNVQYDAGIGEAAFDGLSVRAGNGALYANGALRFVMGTQSPAPSTAQLAASRFLQQASFGPTLAEIDHVAQVGAAKWIDEQIALPFTPDMVAAVDAKFALGDAYRPGGASYTPTWVSQRFWAAAHNSPDQLRRRVGFALHHTLMISQADSNLHYQSRAYAQYLDTLNRHALGNYRNLLEQIALSPAMGIYLSHMRNRPGDAATGRMPDENFAREVMQLFSIGLYELNIDGSLKLDAYGQPIETYTIDDVMALAKVFTGLSWAFPDSQLTESVFRWGNPDLSAAGDQRIDVQPMKFYPGMHSPLEKRLFTGKSNPLLIPAGTSGPAGLKMALDALFNHPNVGPFIGRQLIQHLVTSNPSPAYVARVAATFNNNGAGVRGDMAAVVRAVLLDAEAVQPPVGSLGKLREPVLRVTHWMRSMGALSNSGQYAMVYDLDGLSQRQLYAPSVFGYFRPGYVPPNTQFSTTNITVPEFQIVTESTAAQWVNTAQSMAGSGMGWTGTSTDVAVALSDLTDLISAGQVDAVIHRLNLLLYAGTMSPALKQDILEAMASVSATDSTSYNNRARLALFLALASPEYLTQH